MTYLSSRVDGALTGYNEPFQGRSLEPEDQVAGAFTGRLHDAFSCKCMASPDRSFRWFHRSNHDEPGRASGFN